MKNQNITFIHTVFFWFVENATKEQIEAFVKDVNTLGTIPEVAAFYSGPPAGTPRDVVDNSYGYAINVHFKSKEDHDIYQDHPIHHAFIKNQASFWIKVQVYDNLVA